MIAHFCELLKQLEKNVVPVWAVICWGGAEQNRTAAKQTIELKNFINLLLSLKDVYFINLWLDWRAQGFHKFKNLFQGCSIIS